MTHPCHAADGNHGSGTGRGAHVSVRTAGGGDERGGARATVPDGWYDVSTVAHSLRLLAGTEITLGQA